MNKPRVGIGVVVRHAGKVLLGMRKSALGNGTWSLPGGSLECGESFEACAGRETLEEAGIVIKNMQVIATTNNVAPDGSHHFVTVWVVADYAAGDVRVMEPDKCAQWQWFALNTLPEPRFMMSWPAVVCEAILSSCPFETLRSSGVNAAHDSVPSS